MGSSSNEGNDYPKGSHIEIYDRFVVVTTSEGHSHLHLHECCSNVMFAKAP